MKKQKNMAHTNEKRQSMEIDWNAQMLDLADKNF